MASEHVRRLESRVARTAQRFVREAARTGVEAVALPSVKLPWYSIRNQGKGDGPPDTATVFVFDEIGGSFGLSVDDFVSELENIKAPTIQVRINSPGGSLFDAIAMYNALNHHPARIVVYVDSLAASAASIVAMAGDEVVMMPGSQMMIHDAGCVEDGNSADMAKMATFLDRQSNNIADTYRLRAGGDVADWRACMVAETWMFAAEAVEMRLADRVEEPPKTPDEATAEARSFDLTQFRYAGRENAPAPNRRTSAPRQKRGQAMTNTIAGPRSDLRTAAAARKAAYGNEDRAPSPGDAPGGAARILPFRSQMRAALVDHRGRQMHRVEGYATVFGRSYDMWDSFGPYKEKVNANAANQTLSAGPDVAFLVNHKGITMARTSNGTLELSADTTGLRDVAYLNPERQDVRDLMSAVNDGLITEQSFAFMLTRGLWNEDFDEFEIMEFDIDRGDVSAVNFGASPYTSIAARSRELITQDLDHLTTGAARAALQRLQARTDLEPGPQVEDVATRASAWFAAIDSVVAQAREALTIIQTRAVDDAPQETVPEKPELGLPPSLDLETRSLDSLDEWLTTADAGKYGTKP